MGSFLRLTFRLSTNEGRPLADFKELFRIEESEELDQLGDHSCPSRLRTTQPRTVIPMEVLIEQDVVAPVGVGDWTLWAIYRSP